MIWSDEDGVILEADSVFDFDGLILISMFDGDMCNLTVNQVQDLMSHLQRALDEHGDRQ
jgi:hypothetical protein